MIKVKKYDNEFGRQITLLFADDKILNINFCGNQDLYFSSPMKKEQKQSFFTLTPEDYDLYQMFNKLYNRLINYIPFDNNIIDKDFEEEEKLKKHPLVKDNIITWYSDDDIEEIASVLRLTKNNDKIIINIKQGNCQGFITNSIRICTDGSRYNYFFIPFMELYKEICLNDFNYHQISIEEFSKTLKKK